MPDRVGFVFEREWRAEFSGTPPRTSVASERFEDVTYGSIAAAKAAALEAHHQACQGGWVVPGMRAPSVSELRLTVNGRANPTAVRPGVLLDEVVSPLTEAAHR